MQAQQGRLTYPGPYRKSEAGPAQTQVFLIPEPKHYLPHSITNSPEVAQVYDTYFWHMAEPKR